MAAKICLVLWLPISIGLGGCSTYRAASYPLFGEGAGGGRAEPVLPAVRYGDHVEVTLRSGEKYKGRVMAAGPEVLTLSHGDHASADREPRVRIDVDKIRSIKVRESSPGKSMALVVIIVAPLAAGIAALSSVSVR